MVDFAHLRVSKIDFTKNLRQNNTVITTMCMRNFYLNLGIRLNANEVRFLEYFEQNPSSIITFSFKTERSFVLFLSQLFTFQN